MIIFLLLIIFVVLGSAFFSGLEAALFAISQSKVELLNKKKVRGATSLYKIKENMSRPITVIVIFNNIFNIVGSIYVGVVAANLFGTVYLGAVSALLTFLIIVFGEILPKTLGQNNADRISIAFAPFLLFLTKILSPVVWVFEKITSNFIRAKSIISEEEIQMMSHLGSMEGSIEKDERQMIENVFMLNDLTARDIMTPRTVMHTYQKDMKLNDIKVDLYDEAFSRIPVVGNDIDDIVGIVYRVELISALAKDEHNRKVSEFLKEAVFVDERMRVDHLLPLFQRKRTHIAIVKSEFGGTSGLVTLEDALEELVGEIIDESDDIIDHREEARRQHEESDMEVEK